MEPTGRAIVYEGVQANTKLSVIDAVLMNLVVSMTNPFLGVFVLRLGASDFLLGLVTSLPALINVLFFIPATQLVRRATARLPIVIRYAFVGRTTYLLFALLALLPLPGPLKALVFVLLLAAMNIPGTVTSLAWTEMFGRIFPDEKRAEVVAWRHMFGGIAAMLGTLLSGYFLDLVAFPVNFAVVFSAAYLLAMGSVYTFIQTTESPGGYAQSDAPFKLAPLFAGAQGGRFKYFCLAVFVMQLGVFMTAPVSTVYLVEELSLSNVHLGSLTTSTSLATIFASLLWAYVAGKWGHSLVLMLSMAGIGAFSLLFVLHDTLLYLLALHLFLGVFNAGYGMSVFNLLLEYADPQYKTNSIAFYHTVVNLAAFSAPFLGATLIGRVSFGVIFLVAGVLRLLGVVLLFGTGELGRFFRRDANETYNCRG